MGVIALNLYEDPIEKEAVSASKIQLVQALIIIAPSPEFFLQIHL